MSFESDVQELLGGIRIGTREQRSHLRTTMDQFFAAKGYRAELGSYNNGVLLIHASPAEHALLRYDLPALRQHLTDHGLDDMVDDVKVRTRTIAA